MREIQVKRVEHHGRERWQVIVPPELSATGQRRRRYFKSEPNALEYAGQLNTDRGVMAGAFHRLPQKAQDIVLRVIHRFDGDASELERAADAWLAKRRLDRTLTVGRVADECIRARSASNRRRSYVANLSNSLRHFRAGREDRLLSEVTPAEIDGWLNGSGWRAATRQGFLKDVRTMFSFAVRRGYLQDSPAERVDRPLDDEDRHVGILTLEQIRLLLRRACAIDKPLARWIAVQLFGGLRKSEARRLTEADIKRDSIYVSAKTKTRTKRFVPLNDTLRAWLALSGELPLRNIVRRLRRVRGEMRRVQSKRGVRMKHVLDIPFPRNCLRHSFCSYALPVFGEQKEAEWAGHSPEIAMSTYRELVTEELAREFWAIRPD